MSRKTKRFDMFGVAYRVKQFSAVGGFAFIDSKGSDHPCDMLAETEVLYLDKWLRLDNPAHINAGVFDCTRVIPPAAVLRGVVSIVRDFNFQFVKGWKGVKVPNRFVNESATTASDHAPQLISSLIQEGVATLKELEEYYSIEDAFVMFDVITSKGVNQAIANEDAMKANKRR